MTASQLALLLAAPEDAQPASPTVEPLYAAAAKERQGTRTDLTSGTRGPEVTRARDEAGAAHGAQALGRPRRAVVQATGNVATCEPDAEHEDPEHEGRTAAEDHHALVVGSVHRCLVPRLTDGREHVTTCTVVEAPTCEVLRLRGRVTEWRRCVVQVAGEDAPRTVDASRLDPAEIEAALPYEAEAQRQRQRRQRRRAREALAARQRQESTGLPVESDAGSEAAEGDAEAAHG